MLASLISRLVPVRVASNEEEKQAVYRLRYRVYAKELRKTHIPGIDHERGWIKDEEDDREDSVLLYSGPVGRPAATLRIDLYPPGEVPDSFRKRFSLEVFPELEGELISETLRTIAAPEARGRFHIPALSIATFRFCVEENACRFGFCKAPPGLVQYYRKIGYRLYASRLVTTADGVRVPMMTIASDADYLRRNRSILLPLSRKAFAPGGLPPVDMRPLADRLDDAASPFHVGPKAIREGVLPLIRGRHRIFEGLPRRFLDDLSTRGMIADVPPGELILREGQVERELFVVLDGEVEVARGGTLLWVLRAGEPIGEISMLATQGQRTASIRARTASRLLVLSRRFVEDLIEASPERGGRFAINLARIMADRFTALSRAAGDVPADVPVSTETRGTQPMEATHE